MLTHAEIGAVAALAAQARLAAYAPHSGFLVGAAVVTSDDRVFAGCNVENASYGLTLCAERSALAAAVAAGARAIRAVVLVTATERECPPCGACLQWVSEFGDPETEVVWVSVAGAVVRWTLGDLLPCAFN
jgi:cytidine deaminase